MQTMDVKMTEEIKMRLDQMMAHKGVTYGWKYYIRCAWGEEEVVRVLPTWWVERAQGTMNLCCTPSTPVIARRIK